MASPVFFDFHLHPVFKKFICKYEESYPSTRSLDELTGQFDLTSPLVKLLDEELLHILGSQSCIDQLNEGKLTVGVAAIAPIERLFTNKADGGMFGKILNSGLTKPLDLTYMNNVRDGNVSYYQLFIREVNIYKRLHEAGKIHMLTRQAPQVLNSPAPIPHLALGLEGGHGLCRTLIGQPGKQDTSLTVPPGAEDSLSKDFTTAFTSNPAKSLQQVQQALWEQELDLCYLVLTHLSHIDEQLLATHAYGMKMIKDVSSYPMGNGITLKGRQVIDAAYTLEVTLNGTKTPAPVLIDIKHMSLKSRLDLYAYRKEKKYNLPLIASHIGVTGYSVNAWKEALNEASTMRLSSGEPVVTINVDRKTAGFWGFINKEFTYNAWSINLMDEDIEAVLVSNGLIGISLDVRILGWQDLLSKGDKDEFMSAEEFRFFFPERARQLVPPAVESQLKPTREERHPLALCFNILHVVSVGLIRTDQKPWKQICIGSDYDGLINPVINCRDVSQLSVLEENLIRWLPVAERAYRKENGGGPLLDRQPNGEVEPAYLKGLVRDILYTNGEQFMKRWLTNFQ
ncbi:amidohydrolase family protein [Spirosoma fluviale]|uniref:Membrane dipeptidase (Peptidase family M19) n=1 Tax=Spirosoma fluviale TaxID=1597977 RepID=A0A286FA34_9BACT|nr:hypothetical protein [Spirosoma fluviale]SOD79956.1 hypothetical protein SAMN06269250_1161 [Spirosoma fluviale]